VPVLIGAILVVVAVLALIGRRRRLLRRGPFVQFRPLAPRRRAMRRRRRFWRGGL
jgi:hypothetical protein